MRTPSSDAMRAKGGWASARAHLKGRILMKKMLMILLSLTLILALTAGGCLAESDAQTGASTSDNAAQAADSETSETDTNILIAYFSWSGNTEAVAQIIAEQTGGDLFAIEPATPYTDDYDELLDVARQEQSEDARPELVAQVENWADYDVIFVGYPNWLAYHELIQCTQIA